MLWFMCVMGCVLCRVVWCELYGVLLLCCVMCVFMCRLLRLVPCCDLYGVLRLCCVLWVFSVRVHYVLSLVVSCMV